MACAAIGRVIEAAASHPSENAVASVNCSCHHHVIYVLCMYVCTLKFGDSSMHMKHINIHVYHLSSRSSATQLGCPVKHSACMTGSLYCGKYAVDPLHTLLKKKLPNC